MTSFLLVFSFIFGAIIGSFLNVVSLRFNSGMTLGGRSKCFSCGKKLSWYELFPILSFVLQRGSCRSCKSKISFQYPLVELMTGVLFMAVFYFFPPISTYESFNTLFYLFITSLLILITIHDIKHKIIPDVFSYAFATIALAHLFITPELGFAIPTIKSLLAGPILALPFALLWLVSRGTWMGLGDAKLSLGIGWVLGISYGISAITLAFWIGAVVSLLWMAVVFRKLKTHYEIPFGPYLILGMYIVLFFGVKVIDISAFI